MCTLKFFLNFLKEKYYIGKIKFYNHYQNLETINILKCIMKDLEKDGNLDKGKRETKGHSDNLDI